MAGSRRLAVDDESLIAELRRRAVEVDWELAFDGKSAGNRHLERVARLTDFLIDAAVAAGESPDRFVTRAGAALHDLGLIFGNRDHARTGAVLCEALLRFLDVAEPRRSEIVACVRSHDYGVDEAVSAPVPPATVEARVVHDADTLDKLGPLGAIRHAWKLSVDPERAWTAGELLAFIPGHLDERAGHLHLAPARDLGLRFQHDLDAFAADPAMAEAILERVMATARAGRPTEAIVAALAAEFPASSFVAAARDQIDLTYLER